MESINRVDRPVTIEDIQEAVTLLPAYRKDLLSSLNGLKGLVKRGITVKTNSPLWVQAQNVIYAQKFVEKETNDDRIDQES